MDYFIGIDGGGTKTAFASFDANGVLLHHCVMPSCHVLQVDNQTAIDILKRGLNSVLPHTTSDDNIYIGCGLAGYGNDAHLRKIIENRVECAFKGMKTVIANDAQIGLMGALNGNEGIFIIAGTGSMGLSYRNNEFKRVGGWGYLLGDEASAYWVAKQLLNEYTKQVDGRKEKTKLVDYVKRYCNLDDDYAIISHVSNTLGNKRDEIAKLAPIVYQLAQVNDTAAMDIYCKVAKEISLLINTLAKDFKNTVIVSYTGGVWKGLDYFRNYLTLADNVTLQEPLNQPYYGAYLMARKLKEN